MWKIWILENFEFEICNLWSTSLQLQEGWPIIVFSWHKTSPISSFSQKNSKNFFFEATATSWFFCEQKSTFQPPCVSLHTSVCWLFVFHGVNFTKNRIFNQRIRKLLQTICSSCLHWNLNLWHSWNSLALFIFSFFHFWVVEFRFVCWKLENSLCYLLKKIFLP